MTICRAYLESVEKDHGARLEAALRAMEDQEFKPAIVAFTFLALLPWVLV